MIIRSTASPIAVGNDHFWKFLEICKYIFRYLANRQKNYHPSPTKMKWKKSYFYNILIIL